MTVALKKDDFTFQIAAGTPGCHPDTLIFCDQDTLGAELFEIFDYPDATADATDALVVETMATALVQFDPTNYSPHHLASFEVPNVAAIVGEVIAIPSPNDDQFADLVRARCPGWTNDAGWGRIEVFPVKKNRMKPGMSWFQIDTVEDFAGAWTIKQQPSDDGTYDDHYNLQEILEIAQSHANSNINKEEVA